MLHKLRARPGREGLHPDRAPGRHSDHRHPRRDRLPAFLNQREKAQDSEAKTGVRTTQTAMETIYTDNQRLRRPRRRPTSQSIEPALEAARARRLSPASTGHDGHDHRRVEGHQPRVVYIDRSNAGGRHPPACRSARAAARARRPW